MTSGQGRRLISRRSRRYGRKRLDVPARLVALTEFVERDHRSPVAFYRPTAAARMAESCQGEDNEEHDDDYENYRRCSSLLAAGLTESLAVTRYRSSLDTWGAVRARPSQPPGWLASARPSVPVGHLGGEPCQGFDRYSAR
jgi:hypothetical protein